MIKLYSLDFGILKWPKSSLYDELVSYTSVKESQQPGQQKFDIPKIDTMFSSLNITINDDIRKAFQTGNHILKAYDDYVPGNNENIINSVGRYFVQEGLSGLHTKFWFSYIRMSIKRLAII